MIEYRSSCVGLSPEQLTGFFEGWPHPPSPETHLRLLRASGLVELALEKRADHPRDQVIGFVNAITDGVLSAYIPLLEVLPAYRGRGIGRELMRRVLTRLENLYMVDIVCDEHLQPFYERLGLRRGVAMMLRNYDRQSGTD